MNEIVKIEEFFPGELVHINLPIEEFHPLCYYEGKVMEFEEDFTKVLFPHQGEVYKIKTNLLERTPAEITKRLTNSDGHYKVHVHSFSTEKDSFHWNIEENVKEIRIGNVVKNIIKIKRTYEIYQNPGLFSIKETKNVFCTGFSIFDQEKIIVLSTNSLIPILNKEGERIQKEDLIISAAKKWKYYK